jgi:rhodanese-related sulfurtransferase
MKNLKNICFISTLLSLIFSFNCYAEKKEVSPLTVEGATSITTKQAKELFDAGVLFVDVRSQKAWNVGRIADSVLLDIKLNYTDKNLLAEMKKTDPAIIYCNGKTCLRSAKGAMLAVKWGFTNIYYYRDGYPAWKKAGFPVE